jgi:hypothetical protein
MSKCSVRVVPVLFAGVVAGANLATVTDLRAQATDRTPEAGSIQVAQVADSCLSAPSGATPSGSHWYYRIDRVTKRQCWYLRQESEKADDRFARAAPPESAAASPPSADAPRTRKFTEARAEYTAQQSRAEPPRAETRSIAPAPAVVENTQRAAIPNVLVPAPLSSMRWNDASTAGAAARPAPVQVAAAPAAQVGPQQPQVEYLQQPTPDQVAAVAAAEPAKPTASFRTLLAVMAAALALAGLTVSAIVRIGRMRARRAMRQKRRAMWDSARIKKRAPQPMFNDEDAKLRHATGAMQPARAPRDKTFRDRAPQERAVQQERNFQDRPFQEPVYQEQAFSEPAYQERAFQERTVKERPVKERPVQDRAYQERAIRVPRERAPATQESYAPANRRPAPQERAREQQVTEMLARLARSAQT